MDACLEANLRLVTSQLDHELILTQIVVRVIGDEANSGAVPMARR